MKYKNYFLLSFFFLISYSFANNTDLVTETVTEEEIVSVADNAEFSAEINIIEKLIQLEKDLSFFQENIDQINENQNEKNRNLEFQVERQNQIINDLNNKLTEIEKNIKLIDDRLLTIDGVVQKNNTELIDANNRLSEQINIAKQKTEELINNVNLNDSKTRSNLKIIVGVCSAITLLFIIIIIFIIKKLLLNNKVIEEQRKYIEEEGITLDVKLIEILENQKNILSSSNESESIDHSFSLKVADEITRMQRSLTRIEPSVNGLKPLIKGIERIKKNFIAEGYEIVDLLNKPYVDGMNVEVISYIDDGTLQPDEKIIVKVIRPQVNYKGKLIQRAQIDVAIN